MNHIKAMFSAQARKAYIAAFTVGLAAIAIASESAGITLSEMLTTIASVITAFQATYWTSNAAVYDGALVVNQESPLKDIYSLVVDTPLEEMASKEAITLQVVPNTKE